MSIKLLLGSDPEFFVTKGGTPISAHLLSEGTKEKPLELSNGHIQVDGMALEINTIPSGSYNNWELNHKLLIEEVKGLLPTGHELLFEPTVVFSDEVMESTPDVNKELGCDPDYNAWTEEMNPSPDASSTNMRTGAGHIHFGWHNGGKDDDGNPIDPLNPEHVEACRTLTKALDAYLAPLSLIWDKDNKRRALYGKLGAFRPKPYGMEYRVLSNAWVNDKETRKMVYNICQTVFNSLMKGNTFNVDVEELNAIMDASDMKKGYDLVKSLSITIPVTVSNKYREVITAKSKARGTYMSIGGLDFDVVKTEFECAESFKTMVMNDSNTWVEQAA